VACGPAILPEGRYLTRKYRAIISKIFHKVRTHALVQTGVCLVFSSRLGKTANTAIMAPPVYFKPGENMSDNTNLERESDGVADAIAVTAIIAVVVFTLYLWLAGMPS